jgi:hypothetical protein
MRTTDNASESYDRDGAHKILLYNDGQLKVPKRSIESQFRNCRQNLTRDLTISQPIFILVLEFQVSFTVQSNWK